MSVLNPGLKFDPVLGLRSHGRASGLPYTNTFQSGYMPSSPLISSAVPVHGCHGIESDSDRGTSSSSEREFYGESYSVETSHQQDDKSVNCSVSSMPLPHIGNCASDSEAYLFNSPLKPNAKTARQLHDLGGPGLQNLKLFMDDIPTAPPLADPILENSRLSERLETSRAARSCNSNIAGSNDKNAFVSSLGANYAKSSALPPRLPTFHASGLGSWCAFVSYEACVRLCLHAWARKCMEAPFFLENECAVLRDVFGVKNALLQPEEELLQKGSSEQVNEAPILKPKKTFGKMKVQIRKVKMVVEQPPGCNILSLRQPLESFHVRVSSVKSTLTSGWEAYRNVCVAPRVTSNGSLSQKTLGYMQVGTKYVKELPQLFKFGVNALQNSSSSYEAAEETYTCSVRLKSSSEDEIAKMQPGSSEAHVFLPDGLADDLIVEVHDSNGKCCGRVTAQVAKIADDPGDKLRWWSLYHEPEHELVGRVQLHINYSTCLDENNSIKCGNVAETIAYDFVLEAAMKAQQFKQRNLLLHGSWRWLVTEFASYYGVSDAYSRLRYLSYVMDVATPTADCLDLVHELLLPVIARGRTKETLSHQENRILGEVSYQIEELLQMVFENYKSLDELSPLGMVDVFAPSTGLLAPALASALNLYRLLNDFLSSDTQLKLCRYFQAAAKKRSRKHLAETEEIVNISENVLADPLAISTAYQKMKSLCSNIRIEILTDIEIHNQNVLPSFIDLPNLSSSIYSGDLSNRLRTFLVACPPSCPSQTVTELVIATADFQRDLASWMIKPVKAGVNAKELFHIYIATWIQEKRLSLLDYCRQDKVKWSSIEGSTTPFVDDIYNQLKDTLNEYDIIISRWPEYSIMLEIAIADVEKAIVEALEKQYADALSPLKETSMPFKLGLKYVQKFAKGTIPAYTVPTELGIVLNSMKRMLDILRPRIEEQFKTWGSCIPDGGNVMVGEHLSEVTVILRTKLRAYLQAVMEKLAANTRLQTATHLKRIIQDSKENVAESDLHCRMQALMDLVEKSILQLHTTFDTQVFLTVCRGFWDRMGQDLLRFLHDRKENRSWYKASRVAVSVLDDTFGSKMQQLLGNNALQENDLQPPRSMLEVRSMLCKDTFSPKDNYIY